MTNRDEMIGFVAGVCAGTAVALLCAPRSGAETRSRIREAGACAGERIKEARTAARTKAVEAGNQALDKAAQLVEGARTRLNVNGSGTEAAAS